MGAPTNFYQASIEADVESKVRRTVARLTEFDRSPKRLTYISSKVVRYIDRVETKLTDELDVSITIRDASFISSHVNDDAQAIQAFNDHLRHYTDFLKELGNSNLVAPSRHVNSPAVYVFLSQQLDRNEHDEKSMLDVVTEALGLWGLEGTDPDQNILRSTQEVIQRIDTEMPLVTSLIQPIMQNRLEALADKSRKGGRTVRWHRTENKFCLPYATRTVLEGENAEDEALRGRVLATLVARADETPHPGVGDQGVQTAASVALRALQITFEREGLEFSAFLNNEAPGEGYPTIADSIRSAMADQNVTGKRAGPIGSLAFQMLRGTFYRSAASEREYLHRLSKTYALLFTLRTEPRLINFFEEMTGRLYLYVGSDVLMTALSEQCLPKEDQITRNTLLMATRLGAKLILTGPVLEEVTAHLRACDLEYKNHIGAHEPAVNDEQARQAPHIMLRAYLYTRTAPAPNGYRPPNWPAFINLFCGYPDLHREAASEDLRRYLQSSFGMDYRSKEDLMAISDPSEVGKLTKALLPYKKNNQHLAENDALLALAVYGHRQQRRETHSDTEFGLNTWWLTSETRIVRLTQSLIQRHGARYIMRPDSLCVRLR